MRPKTLSVATLGLLSALLAGLVMLVGCGGSSSGSPPPGSPAVTLSPTSLTFSSGVGVQSAAQSVTVTDSGSATLTLSGITVSPSSFAQSNNCGANMAAGGSCTISVTFTPSAAGTVSGTLTITDNASNSPQTVPLSGTGSTVFVSPTSLAFSGVAVGTTSVPQSVTLNNVGTTAVAITSITISGDFSQTNTCGTSLAASGTCTISVTFAPQGSGPWTGTLTVVDAAGTQTAALTGTTTATNTVPVSVNLGPNNNLVDGIYTTVTVCYPGSTTNCTTIPNVLVDTDSVGLRVLGTGAAGVSTQVGNLNLPQVTDPTTTYPLYECVQYGDLSFTWGPMQMATVQVGGETASQVPASAGGTANAGIPIQVISTGTPPEYVSYEDELYYNPCLVNPATGQLSGGADDDTVANLGSNGILGIGLFPQDCTLDTTNYCTSLETTTGQYLAYQASTGDAYVEPTAVTEQAWNPVAAFPVDNNGELLSLPSIPATGQATATGTLTFGIGTETNNAMTTQTVYEVDCDGDFLQATFNGVNYNDVDNQTDCSSENPSFIDSGSNGLFFLDPTTLTDATGVSTVNCSDNADWYCPASTLDLSPPNLGLTLYGDNDTSGTVSLSIANADTLFSYDYGAYSDLAGTSISSGEPTSDDSIDLGLPFFFGRLIFVGISEGTQYPNGYWAF